MVEAPDVEPTVQQLKRSAIFRLVVGFGGIAILSVITAAINATGYKGDFVVTAMAILFVGCAIQVLYGIAGVKDWLDSGNRPSRSENRSASETVHN